MGNVMTSHLDNDKGMTTNKNAHIKIPCSKCDNLLVFQFQLDDLFVEKVQMLIDFIVSNHWTMNGESGFVCDQPHGE